MNMPYNHHIKGMPPDIDDIRGNVYFTAELAQR